MKKSKFIKKNERPSVLSGKVDRKVQKVQPENRKKSLKIDYFLTKNGPLLHWTQILIKNVKKTESAVTYGDFDEKNDIFNEKNRKKIMFLAIFPLVEKPGTFFKKPKKNDKIFLTFSKS